MRCAPIPATTIVLVTPAFPETGRTVYQGNLFVGSVPLNESPLKDHPLNPMHDSNLVRVLARQSRTKIGLVDLADVARGPDAVRARLADLAGQGIGAAIVDAVFERDLETIGEVALDHRLSVGASGLGLGLARALVASGRVKSNAANASVRRAGRRPGGVPCRQLFAGDAAADRQRRAGDAGAASRSRAGRRGQATKPAARWPGPSDRLEDGPILIASSSTPDEVAALQARHGRDAAGHAIEQAMADIAEGLVQSGVRRLVVAGGETSGAVVDRLGIPGFLVGAEIAAGVPVLRAVGAKARRDAAGAEVGQFRRPGVLLRRAQADALSATASFRDQRLIAFRSPTGRS